MQKTTKRTAKGFTWLHKSPNLSPKDLSSRQQYELQREDEYLLATRAYCLTDISQTELLKNIETSQDLETKKTKQVFEDLVKTWKKATIHLSYINHKITHRNYLRIIGMGEKALPFIFAELQKQPSSSWFPALEAITGINDITVGAKSISEAVSRWLEWGKQNHHL